MMLFISLIALSFVCSQAASVGQKKISSYSALGDSYAAGDGAGASRLLPGCDVICGRFSGAYPVRVANALHLTQTGWLWKKFHTSACGGATTKNIVWDQLYHVKGVDLVTLQIGGNEVDFFPVLNECIQQWHPLSSCDRELVKSQNMIKSTKFVEAFDRMMKYATYVKRDDAHLLVLGYAKFFNAQTEQCNNATFSLTNPANILSNELRHAFNDLVVMLNSVIRASAEAHGAVYVDIDEVFEGHRFCEEGVIEPRPDWEGTWFFRETVKQDGRPIQDMSWPVNEHPDQQQLVLSNSLRKFSDLTRTFHPTNAGHTAIARKIVSIVQQLLRHG